MSGHKRNTSAKQINLSCIAMTHTHTHIPCKHSLFHLTHFTHLCCFSFYVIVICLLISFHSFCMLWMRSNSMWIQMCLRIRAIAILFIFYYRHFHLQQHKCNWMRERAHAFSSSSFAASSLIGFYSLFMHYSHLYDVGYIRVGNQFNCKFLFFLHFGYEYFRQHSIQWHFIKTAVDM